MRDTTAALADWLARGGQTMGQIQISRGGAEWDLRHVEDASREDLAASGRWQDARSLANLDDAGAYRPLKTAPNLRHGWRLTLSTVDDVRRALDYFYPAMLGLWLSHQQGEVVPTCLRDTLGRQTGMYRITQKLSDEQAQSLVLRTCHAGSCAKTLLWQIQPDLPVTSLPPEKFAVSHPHSAWPLLCQEACNIFVASARKVVKGEPPA